MATATLRKTPKPRTPPAPKPQPVTIVRRGGRYAAIKSGPRVDIPEVRSFRSGLDADLYRWLRHVRDGGTVLDPYMERLLTNGGQLINVEYEQEHGDPAVYTFPGVGTTGRAKYLPDLFVQILWQNRNRNTGHVTYSCPEFYVEGKGVLKDGGWLLDVDLKALARVDSKSAEKLRRWLRYKPGKAGRTFVVGQREHKVLGDCYRKVIPHWGE